MPRDFTAAPSGGHRRRYDLGMIRWTGLDMQTDFPAIFPPSPGEDPSNSCRSGSGYLGDCAATRCSSHRGPAELCRASGTSKGRHCCSGAVASAFSRRNPELGIRLKRRYRKVPQRPLKHGRGGHIVSPRAASLFIAVHREACPISPHIAAGRSHRTKQGMITLAGATSARSTSHRGRPYDQVDGFLSSTADGRWVYTQNTLDPPGSPTSEMNASERTRLEQEAGFIDLRAAYRRGTVCCHHGRGRLPMMFVGQFAAVAVRYLGVESSRVPVALSVRLPGGR
jgi:hypothetical protein